MSYRRRLVAGGSPGSVAATQDVNFGGRGGGHGEILRETLRRLGLCIGCDNSAVGDTPFCTACWVAWRARCHLEAARRTAPRWVSCQECGSSYITEAIVSRYCNQLCRKRRAERGHARGAAGVRGVKKRAPAQKVLNWLPVFDLTRPPAGKPWTFVVTSTGTRREFDQRSPEERRFLGAMAVVGWLGGHHGNV